MKAEISSNWMMKSVMGFTFEKLEKLCFQKIILKFFVGTFRDFFLESSKNDDRTRASVYIDFVLDNWTILCQRKVFSKDREYQSENYLPFWKHFVGKSIYL